MLKDWKQATVTLCSTSFEYRLAHIFSFEATNPNTPPHPMFHKFFTNHQYSASSSTAMVAHSDESQTKPHARSLGGDNSHLEERRKISPLGYTSWMASAATQHPKPEWSRMESGCVFLLMLVPVQTSLLVRPIWLSPFKRKQFKIKLSNFKSDEL